MKALFYSVAVIAMCLLLSCGRNAEKSDVSAQNMVLSNDKPEEQNKQKTALTKFTPPKIVKDEEAQGIASNDVSTETADTASAVMPPPDPGVLQAGNPVTEDWDKKIIKTARVTLELKDYKLFNTTIHSGLKRYGAYIAGEQQSESDARIENTLIIKVPVAQFEDLMNIMNGSGIKMLEKNISTEDVTGEMVDTKARIEAKKQVRDKYMELLKQAKSMKDILAVQEEINSIQEDLEAASGRVNYLTHNAAYSTINLTYYQYLNGNSSDTIEPSFLTKLKDAFATGGAVITNCVLLLISLWPLVLAGAALLLYVKRWKVKKA